jgi:hypothetical protein
MAVIPESNESPGGDAASAARIPSLAKRAPAPAGQGGRRVRALTPRVRLYACIAAANHGTTIARVLGESRARRETAARREVWRRLYDDGFSYAAIGRFTDRDHATVMHGLKKILGPGGAN